MQVETLKTVRLNGRDVPPGQIVEIDDSLTSFWLRKGLAKAHNPVEDQGMSDLEKPKEELPDGLILHGGGWYELPTGEKIQGKDDALAAYETLKAAGGDVNNDARSTQIGNTSDSGASDVSGNQSPSEG